MIDLQEKYGLKRFEHVIETGLHEHGNLPDFKFVVEAKDYNESIEREETYENTESHALIFCNSMVAVTMFEYCFALWHVDDGFIICGNLWKKQRFLPGEENRNWRLTKESVKNIKRYLEDLNGS